MFTRWACRAAIACGFALIASPSFADTCVSQFDDPLERVFATSGDNFKIATAAVGTQDGLRELQINIPGTPVAAFVFWAGDTRVGGGSDPSISLSGGKLNSAMSLDGEEVGRRHQIFSDAINSGCSGSGGETVMQAEVPASAFGRGFNRFTISNFNERSSLCEDSPSNIYRQQYGVALLVIYAEKAVNTNRRFRGRKRALSKGANCHTPGSCERDVTIMLGADIASARSFVRGPNCEKQANTEETCFRMSPLRCNATAQLVVGMAGTQAYKEVIGGRTYTASQEKTWFKDSTSQEELIGGGDLVEFNQLIDYAHFYRGRVMSMMETTVQLKKGATEACFQVEMLPKQQGEIPQNALLFLGALSIDRSCK